MPTIRLNRLLINFALLCATQVSRPVLAAPAQIQIPQSFDKATVTSLLQNIDRSRNDTLLKLFYFSRRNDHALPLRDGWQLLNEACTQAKPYSHQWFLLQNVKGFAGLRLSFVEKSAPYDAYDAIFDNAPHIENGAEGYSLYKTLQEFLTAQRLEGVGIEVSRNPRFTPTLSKAWMAYSASQGALQNYPSLRNFWIETFTKCGIPKDLISSIHTQWNDKTLVDAPAALAVAGFIVLTKDKNESIAMWTKAKEYYWLHRAEKGVASELDWVYDQIIETQMQVQNAEAKKTILERISRLNTGRGALLEFQEASDPTFIDKIIADVLSPPVNESELFEVADKMYEMGYDLDGHEVINQLLMQKGILLLSSYLEKSAPNGGNRIGQLNARLILCKFYTALDKKKEALDVLESVNLDTPNADDTESFLSSEIKRQKAQLRTLTAK